MTKKISIFLNVSLKIVIAILKMAKKFPNLENQDTTLANYKRKFLLDVYGLLKY